MAVTTAALTSTNDSIVFVGQSPPVIQITGTWVGTIAFEHSIANGIWGTLQTYTSNDEEVAIVKEGSFRARFTSYTSGTATIALGDSDTP